MRKYLLYILAITVPLAACGVKPKSVKAPEGAEEIVFPRTYPTEK
jgi:hypothetical protein